MKMEPVPAIAKFLLVGFKLHIYTQFELDSMQYTHYIIIVHQVVPKFIIQL